ncbi:PREDICTED: uncharacterized protein LOC105957418 isoform X1 [Erythranthe guttata]|uniref:uncharacterized protein LOC105957418 isoform X1 n=1 Tax=Erythranthe guttata TaxID=4155 RepID=UPI00064E14D5|nr:PREDICTED: uncharacterized protein LOC105957418 isoform X1 [Erythranthe guttata]|eukprot:XP_012836794.1 PREDICTED: uncharacterized protein LOC105957418 isoform X1 [Erythranthe guttata]
MIISPDELDVDFDVDDGFNNTIGRMVKWIGISYDVKVKKLKVAFDPLLEEEQGKKALGRILVFQSSEVECETRISNNASSCISTVVKYEEVVLEVLNVDVLDHQLRPERTTGNMTRIISGKNGGGILGNFRLSLPWKNGSLDIGKVEVDFYVEPHELRLQPSTIRCFIFMGALFNDMPRGTSTGLLEKFNALQVLLDVEMGEKLRARKMSNVVVSLLFVLFIIILVCEFVWNLTSTEKINKKCY